MDILDESIKIWNEINDISTRFFETKIVIDEDFIGKNNNCLSSVAKGTILLDGSLNQLHFVKRKDNIIIHNVMLMTPQPINPYSQIELSYSKQFVALIGCDTVGIVDISNILLNKSCKKVKEVFKTHDDILAVKWYPQMNDCLVVLTKQSINIFLCRSDMRIIPCYQFYLNVDINAHSKSFGIKEEFVAFDFGSSENITDDNIIFMLTDSGEILLLPEIRKLNNNEKILPKKLTFYPPSDDNYQDDFTSLAVLRGSIDIIVLVNCNGFAQHAFVINEKVCVYETVNVSTVHKNVNLGPIIITDRHAYPPRYLLLHTNGIHSCILPWSVRLRLAVQGKGDTNLNTAFKEAGYAIIDHALDMTPIGVHKAVQNKIRGVTILREAMNSPELCLFVYGNNKRIVKAKLRQESTLMTPIDIDNSNKYIKTLGHVWPIDRDSTDIFINAILSKLSQGGRIPCVAASLSDKDDECDAKLALVMKISEKLTGDFGTRIESAGQIFDQRMLQMNSIVELQQDQVNDIILSTKNLQTKAKKLAESFHATSSRQRHLLKRLSECSNKLAAINSVIPREDRESANKIKNVEKRLSSMKALLRGCKLRFEQNENYIDLLKKQNEDIGGDLDIDKEKAQMFLVQEDNEIKSLVEDIRSLMN